MNLVMIGVIKVGNTLTPIIGYRLLDTETNQVKDVPAQGLIDGLVNGLIISNLSVMNREIVGTNGAISRYPLILNGRPYDKSPLIVLKVMNNGDYTVSDFKGEIVRMTSEEAVRYSEQEGIANGKVVDREGTKYISAIYGEYEQEPKVDVAKNADKIQVKWDMLDIRDYAFNEKDEFYIINKELDRVKIPTGVNRIAARAFQNMRLLKGIALPPKLECMGEGAFRNCIGLTSIEIPNGIKVITTRCFEGCASLSEVVIGESVNKIESRAFLNCRKLKRVTLKNPQTIIELGALPPGCRKIIGR